MTEIDRLAESLGIRTGVFPGVSWEEYSKWPGVSITRLKHMSRSPKHYRHYLAHPKDSAAMSLGRAAHVAVLEPERFAEIPVWDAGPRRGGAWEAFKALHGRNTLTIDERDAAKAIAKAVREDDRAMRYLCEGEAEVSMQWIGDGGIACKGRVDWLTKGAIVGLKTTRDIRMPFFGKQAINLGYLAQWAYYCDGWAEAIGPALGVRPLVVEIVVEAEAPHDVAVYHIEDDELGMGRNEYTRMLATLAKCEASGVWPGAMPGETRLELPAWAYREDDDVEALGLEGFEDE